MATANKSLGEFNLEGIPPSQRGMPQIEVSFDIDANGIMKVKAVDKATSKEQQIRIEASSGLSKDEVERMRSEAEAHAGEDKARRELVELKNQVDAVVHETEKQLREHGDKLSETDRKAIETAKEDLKQAAAGDDKEKLQSSLQTFQQKAQKLGEAIYAKQGAGAGGDAAPGGTPSGGGGTTGGAPGGDEPVDADFEVKA